MPKKILPFKFTSANLKFTMKVYKVIKPRVVSGNISLAEDKQNFSDSTYGSPGNTGCGGVVRIDKCDLGDFGEFHKFKC